MEGPGGGSPFKGTKHAAWFTWWMFIKESVTESQDNWGWKGSLQVTESEPPAKLPDHSFGRETVPQIQFVADNKYQQRPQVPSASSPFHQRVLTSISLTDSLHGLR